MNVRLWNKLFIKTDWNCFNELLVQLVIEYSLISIFLSPYFLSSQSFISWRHKQDDCWGETYHVQNCSSYNNIHCSYLLLQVSRWIEIKSIWQCFLPTDTYESSVHQITLHLHHPYLVARPWICYHQTSQTSFGWSCRVTKIIWLIAALDWCYCKYSSQEWCYYN